MKITRQKNNLRLIFVGMFLWVFGLLPGPVFALEVSVPTKDLTALVGERLEYDIGFLWLDHLGEGYLSFNREEEGTFQAVLEARTLGVIAWLTDYQRQRFVATMELGENGRLRTLKYDSLKIKGQGADRHIWTKSYIFDYKEEKIRYLRIKDGREASRKVFPLNSANPPADALTTLYNFRRGVYGKILADEPLVVPAFGRGRSSDIKVEISPPSSQSARDFFESCRPIFKVTVDPEVFDTGGGFVYACLDEQGRPFKGIVENVLGLGDVRGSMKVPRKPGR